MTNITSSEVAGLARTLSTASPAGVIRGVARVAQFLGVFDALQERLPEDEKVDGATLVAYAIECLRPWGGDPRPSMYDPRCSLVADNFAAQYRSKGYQHLRVLAACLRRVTPAGNCFDYAAAYLVADEMAKAIEFAEIPAEQALQAFDAYRSGATEAWFAKLGA